MTIKSIKYLLLFLGLNACAQPDKAPAEIRAETIDTSVSEILQTPIPAAELIASFLPLIKGKTIGILANQTSMVGNTHLVDSLLSLGINVKKVFAPEHGFRGNADAGEKVEDGKDKRTGLPILSLYGKNLKPSTKQLKGIDLILFDIQDVGARFYTYISTMSYMMETCAEQGIPMVVLDRPNPNGHYVDGPILNPEFSSFVGMHPVPVVHGMTMGEYAKMVNGQGWLKDSVQCALTIIKMKNYTHHSSYELPVQPSPNLPNQRAIYLYPSLCFFEGTIVSAGRGTDTPFQLFGYPNMPNSHFKFTPRSIKGAASNPKFKDEQCVGTNLSGLPLDSLWNRKQLDLNYLINAYRDYRGDKSFFQNKFFDMLAGGDELRKQIISGKSEQEIRDSWQEELKAFRKLRAGYLLYP